MDKKSIKDETNCEGEEKGGIVGYDGTEAKGGNEGREGEGRHEEGVTR